jgi:hypothetical protein
MKRDPSSTSPVVLTIVVYASATTPSSDVPASELILEAAGPAERPESPSAEERRSTALFEQLVREVGEPEESAAVLMRVALWSAQERTQAVVPPAEPDRYLAW